jgi:hypothetical protein
MFDSDLSGFDSVRNEEIANIDVSGSFATRSSAVSLEENGAFVILTKDIVINLAALSL